MMYCGIDIANKTSAWCVMDGNRQILKEGECGTDADGFRQALSDAPRLACVLEASPLSEWLAEVLEELGHEVAVIDPRRAKAVITNKKKTDKLDARNLARMSVTGWYTQVHRKSASCRLLRSHLKARAGLLKSLHDQQSRIRGLLRAHGIKLGQVSAGEYEHQVLVLLDQRCPGLRPAIEPLLMVRRYLRQALADMTKLIKQQARQDKVNRLLMSVPGVGPLVSSAYQSTIDDPARFSDSRQVAAYLGLVPGIKQSGQSCYRSGITKEGDGMLRGLLVEAGHVLLTRTHTDSALKRWGLQVQARCGSSKAKVAVARKLAILLHRIWLDAQPFEPRLVQ